MDSFFIPMDLQLFADSSEVVNSTENMVSNDVGSTDKRSFSQDDVNNIVKGRVQRATRDLEREVNDLKARLDGNAQSEDEENIIEEKSDSELESLRLENLNYKLTEVATKALESRGYQADENILEVVVGSDEELTLKAVKTFASIVEALVNKKIKESAREVTPRGGNSSLGGTKKFSIGDFASQKRVAR